MTREEAQSAWEKIVDTGFSDYNKLNRDQRVWFNIEPPVRRSLQTTPLRLPVFDWR